MKKKFLNAVLLVNLMFLCNCKEDVLDYSNVITFINPAEESLVADNFSTLAIIAHIDPKSDPDKKAITFTTDIGTFTNNQVSIVINADKDGNATAYLKSSSTGKSLVSASAQSLKVTKSVLFTPFLAISLTAPGEENLAADNVSSLKIAAKINPDTEADKRSVVFTTDLGFFSNNQKSVTIIADDSGTATTYIKGDQVGTAAVKVTNQNSSVNKTINFTPADPDNLFKVLAISDNIAADNASAIQITASVNRNLPLALQVVTFTSDAGTFNNAGKSITVNADPSGNASTYLKSDVAGTAHVAVSLAATTRHYNVNFIKAVPDFIQLSSNNSIANGISNSITITISLKRNIGKPGSDFAFDYLAVDAAGNPIGIFNNGKLSNENGEATVSYSAGDTAYKGPVKITISLKQHPAVKASVDLIVL